MTIKRRLEKLEGSVPPDTDSGPLIIGAWMDLEKSRREFENRRQDGLKDAQEEG